MLLLAGWEVKHQILSPPGFAKVACVGSIAFTETRHDAVDKTGSLRKLRARLCYDFASPFSNWKLSVLVEDRLRPRGHGLGQGLELPSIFLLT